MMIDVLRNPHPAEEIIPALPQAEVRAFASPGRPDPYPPAADRPVGSVPADHLEIAVPERNAYAVPPVIHQRDQSRTEATRDFQARPLENIRRVRTGDEGDAAV